MFTLASKCTWNEILNSTKSVRIFLVAIKQKVAANSKRDVCKPAPMLVVFGLKYATFSARLKEKPLGGSDVIRCARRCGGKKKIVSLAGDVSCTNTILTSGVSMHDFPLENSLIRQWTSFVQRHRSRFKPSKGRFTRCDFVACFKTLRQPWPKMCRKRVVRRLYATKSHRVNRP